MAAVTSSTSATKPAVTSGNASSTAATNSPPIAGYDPARDPGADIKAALRQAASDHREVLLDFGANWCPDCQVLDTLFRSAQVEPLLLKDYHVVAVDVGRFDRNLKLAATYVDLQTSGIPALVVLTPSGAVRIATNDGAFSNARAMDPGQVNAFLAHWAPAGG
ncbi:MAG: thioredoxin family protein [Actinocrinis sp.]